MARQLSDKSKVIREAIQAKPEMGNTELAEYINDSADRLDDKISVTAQDVGNQKQALKALGDKPAAEPEAAPQAARNGAPKQKPGRKPGQKPAAVPVAAEAVPAPATPARPGDLVGATIALAKQCGGLDELKKLVGVLEGLQK